MNFLILGLFSLVLFQMVGCKALNDVSGFEEEFGPFVSPGNNTVSPPAICEIPLDRDTSGFNPVLWTDGALSLDTTKQIASHVLQSGEDLSRGVAGATITGISSKSVAFEFEMKLPKSNTGTNDTPVGAGVFLFNEARDKHITFIIISKGNDTYDYFIRNGMATIIWSQPNMPDHPSRIGFLLENGIFRIWLDGVEVDITSLNNTFDSDDVFPVLVSETNAVPGNLNGETYSMQLFSNISSMTSPFPAGSEDACGNTL